MLAELFLYALSPAPLAMHRKGLVRDAVSLWSRARRCRAAWAPHEAECHAMVRQMLAHLSPGGTVMVLGSGLMRDVPLGRLRAHFERVVLVDAVHLLPVRLRTMGQRGVNLVTADLGGEEGGAVIAGLVARWRPDCLISANLLSQLALAAAEGTAAAVVRSHLDALKAAGCPVLLLTDTEEVRLDRMGRMLDRIDLLAGVALPGADRTWDWELAPFGEVAAGERLVHRAGGWMGFGNADHPS